MSGTAIRVAMIEPVGGHGGMDYYDFALCDGLAANNIEPILFTCDETSARSENYVVETPYEGIYGVAPKWRRALRFVRGTFRAVLSAKRRGAQLAHMHFFHSGVLELLNVAICRLFGLKVVVTSHDVESFIPGVSSGVVNKWIYGLTTAVVAHNKLSALELSKKLEISESKINIIPHGNYFSYKKDVGGKTAARSHLGIDSDSFVILFFGQIKEVKGLEVLLKAIPLLDEVVRRRVRLVIAGKVWKDEFAKYLDIIEKNSLSDCITLEIRYIHDNEVSYFYQCADAVVLPYKRIYQSGVVLMAMSFGIPVIVSNIPGMLEVVTDAETGLVFKSEDPTDLARCLNEAERSPQKLQRMAKAAEELMGTKYSWASIGRDTSSLYRRILC